MARRRTLEEAQADFWSRVDKGECWIWTGARFRQGYGRFKHWGRDTVAHRFSYEWEVGAVPEGLELDHLCKNKGCVRPSHLEAVTASVNQRRTNSPVAKNASKTHCVRGHALSGTNVYRKSNGGRGCRECHRMHGRKSYRVAMGKPGAKNKRAKQARERRRNAA